MGRPEEMSRHAESFNDEQRNYFRILARALANECELTADEWRKSRRALVSLVRQRTMWKPWLADNAGVLGFKAFTTATRMMKAATNGKSTSHLEADEAAQISRQTWGNKRNRTGSGSFMSETFPPAGNLNNAALR